MEFSLLVQPTLIFVATLLLLLLKVWSKTKKHSNETSTNTIKPRNAPPQPPGAWPIIGHLPLLMSSTQIHRAFATIAERYSPVFQIRMGMTPTLIVSTKELAKQCFTTNDQAFATRPTTIAGKLMAYDHSVMGFAPYGPEWRETRKIATVELFSARRLSMLKSVRSAEVTTWVNSLHEMWIENGKKALNLEFKGELECLMFNVLMKTVAGKRYYGNNVAKSDEEMSKKFRSAVKNFNHHLGTSGIYDALPFLAWFDFKGDAKAMKQTQADMDFVMQNWLDEHRAKDSSNDSSRDFIDVLLSMEKNGKLSEIHDVDKMIKSLVLTQLLAGVDSMSNTIVWVISLLLSNREALTKVQQELDTKVGKERLVEESDVSSLTYLQAVLKETFRLFPIGPLLVPHEAMEDCQVGGYHIARGTGLFVNAWMIHRDPTVWADPDQFLPERFLTTHKDVDVKGQHFELLPFGSGRRSCPGSGLALHIMHITLARVLQAFELETLPGENIDLEEGFGLILYKLKPLQVRVSPRLPSEFYRD